MWKRLLVDDAANSLTQACTGYLVCYHQSLTTSYKTLIRSQFVGLLTSGLAQVRAILFTKQIGVGLKRPINVYCEGSAVLPVSRRWRVIGWLQGSPGQ